MRVAAKFLSHAEAALGREGEPERFRNCQLASQGWQGYDSQQLAQESKTGGQTCAERRGGILHWLDQVAHVPNPAVV